MHAILVNDFLFPYLEFCGGSLKAYLMHLFTVCGGGERVSLEIAKALHDVGFNVVYVTNSSKCLRRCAEMFGLSGDYETIEISSVLEKFLSVGGRFIRYRRLLLLAKAYEELMLDEAEGLRVDTSTNVPFKVDVSYIHYPAVLGTTKSETLYWRLYNWVVELKVRRIAGNPKLVITNSLWSAKLVREVYGLEAEVVHPPVDVDYFTYDSRTKEKVIVTVSRFTPEKKLHLLPRVASKLSEYEWYLAGSTGSTWIERSVSNTIVRRIESEVRENKVRNFYVIPNIPREELRELLLRATYYVHPPFAEHFGIAVAEAMAAGCIPIVYRDGGAWTDIVSQIYEGLGYNDLSEVPLIIKSIENSPNLINELRVKAITQVQQYRSEVFREKFIEILKRRGII